MYAWKTTAYSVLPVLSMRYTSFGFHHSFFVQWIFRVCVCARDSYSISFWTLTLYTNVTIFLRNWFLFFLAQNPFKFLTALLALHTSLLSFIFRPRCHFKNRMTENKMSIKVYTITTIYRFTIIINHLNKKNMVWFVWCLFDALLDNYDLYFIVVRTQFGNSFFSHKLHDRIERARAKLNEQFKRKCHRCQLVSLYKWPKTHWIHPIHTPFMWTIHMSR